MAFALSRRGVLMGSAAPNPVDPGEWVTLYDDLGTTQNIGWGGYTVRNRLRADDSIILSNTGPYCRLRFSAGSSQQGRIDTAFVATIPDAQTSFVGADWVPVRFSGASAVTIAAGDSLWSDPLFLADWGDEDHEQLLISFWASSAGNSSWKQKNISSAFPGRGSWLNTGSTNASDSTESWGGTSRTEIYAVTGIESRAVDPVVAVMWREDRLPGLGYALDNGNTRFDQNGYNNLQKWVQSDLLMTRERQGLASGFYWEVSLFGTTTHNGYNGVVERVWASDSSNYDGSQNPITGGALGYRGNGEFWGPNGARLATGLAAYGNGDRIMFAFDATTGDLWCGKNGVWDRDPATDVARGQAVGSEFRVSGQGRYGTDGGRLWSRPEDFSYTIPTGFTALAVAGDPLPSALTLQDTGAYAVLGRRTGKATLADAAIYAVLEE